MISVEDCMINNFNFSHSCVNSCQHWLYDTTTFNKQGEVKWKVLSNCLKITYVFVTTMFCLGVYLIIDGVLEYDDSKVAAGLFLGFTSSSIGFSTGRCIQIRYAKYKAIEQKRNKVKLTIHNTEQLKIERSILKSDSFPYTRSCPLPDDLLLLIFSSHSKQEILAASLVCKHWCKLASSPLIWKKFFNPSFIVKYPNHRKIDYIQSLIDTKISKQEEQYQNYNSQLSNNP